MTYKKTTAYKRIKALTARIRAVQGGTSASKTVSITLFLIAAAQSDETPTLTSIVAESFPHLRRGAMRDFEAIMKAHNYWVDSRWDKTNSVYTFETGSKIEFFSVDQSEKVRGARRDRLFINEANNVSFAAFEELEVRTKDFVILDWNPTNEFWYYTDVEPKRTDCERIILTYRDNEALDESIVNSIEQRKDNKSWFTVYGLGQLGQVEGKIYREWKLVEEVPHTGRLERRGLDFGYSNDPTAIVSVYYQDGGFILDENCFQKGLSNKQIADLILNLPAPQTLVIADSAEPKSIDELKAYGVNVLACEKGADSVRNGIQIVQDQRISVTQRSTHLWRAYQNYMWKFDKDGKPLSPNVPDHAWSDCMDAVRYAIASIKKKPIFTMQASKPLLPYYGSQDVPF